MPKPDRSDNNKAPGPGPSSPPGVFDMLDLTPPLRKTYQAILKSADISYEDASSLVPDESPEELRMYLNILARLGYIEKYPDNGTVRFKLKNLVKNASALSDSIWKKLE